MEKIKTIIAVVLFVATLLFAAINDQADKEKEHPKTHKKIVINK